MKIIKYQNSGKLRTVLKKAADKFSQATLRAAMADRPEIMQASGWDWDKGGNIVQGDPSAEGPTALRKSLAEIAAMPAIDLVGDVAGAAVVGSKLYKSAKLAKEINKAVKNTKLSVGNIEAAKRNITYTPKNIGTGKTYYDHLSRGTKLSDDELAGITKAERNAQHKVPSYEEREIKRFLDEKSNVSQKSKLPFTMQEIDDMPQYGDNALRSRQSYVKEMEDMMPNSLISEQERNEFNALLQDYISSLGGDIDARFASTFKDGVEQPSIAVRAFRNFLREKGFDASKITNDDLARLLTQQYKDLSSQATGKLNKDILWHGSKNWFDEFDFKGHMAESTGNSGALGPGNYFSLSAGPYGRTKNPINFRMNLNNTQPYIVTGVTSTPNGATMIKKGILPEYISKSQMETEAGREMFRKILDKTPINDNRAYLDFTERAAGMGADYNAPAAGIMIRRNTGIKSLFPHPTRFYRDVDGVVRLRPTDWLDARFNFGDGGKLK